eukprot:scaffold51059_cov22-Tisochrysis_lutea.AAC.1
MHTRARTSGYEQLLDKDFLQLPSDTRRQAVVVPADSERVNAHRLHLHCGCAPDVLRASPCNTVVREAEATACNPCMMQVCWITLNTQL